MIEVVTIDTPSLGDRTYLATDGASALVIDPQRDIDRVLAAAAAWDVAVTHVFETHIHNDYVSGGLALARRCGAACHVNAADAVAFGRVGISDGDVITVGQSMQVRVIATPGHTFTHLAYALEDAVAGEAVAVFTGGSCCTARPAARTCSAPGTRSRSRPRSTPRPGGWPGPCRTAHRCTRPTASAASAPPSPPGPPHRPSGTRNSPTRR